MTRNNKKNINFFSGFTLIELLVVVAIIGILAGIVLAFLSSARSKGQVAAIKSNLKNMIAQAELTYDGPNNYSAVCTDPTITSILTSINKDGATSSCYSLNNSGWRDINTRWGATALIKQTAFQAYSVDSSGVFTWDTVDQTPGTVQTWADANSLCAAEGASLPTIEQLYTLSQDAYASSSPQSYTPTGFMAYRQYWSSTSTPYSPSDVAYFVFMGNGRVYTSGKYASNNVRCVR